MAWWWLVIVLLGVLMFVDEVFFHRKREVPAWERWGHPIDAMVVLIALVILWWEGPMWLYATVAMISCLTVTKDEWVHARLCTPTEHWLHAVLFLLHPVFFYAAYQLRWTYGTLFLWMMAIIALSITHQVWFWNYRGSTNKQ